MADPERSARQVAEIVCEGRVTCVDGTKIKFHADSICLHSDTPGAGMTATAVSNALKKRGVTITPLLQTIL